MKRSIVIIIVLLTAICAPAGDKDHSKEKEKKASIDSGVFGIYLGGKRIGTEKFNIEQQADEGIATAEITVDDGTNKAEQSSELRVGRDGKFRLYKWRSITPVKEESTVEPKEDSLIEHLITGEQKKREVPYILPVSTVILDDNFFSQRELLIWKYLSGCQWDPPAPPGQQPPPGAHLLCSGAARFGILVPHQHTPGNAVVELVGRDKITVKGVERELNKFKLDTDGVQWFIWVEDNYKVTKMAIPSGNVEVWRE